MPVPLVSVVTWSPTRFQDALDARGLSDDELAQLVGVSSSTIRSYRRGATAPSPPVLVKVAEALGVSIAGLAPLSGQPSLHELRWRAGHTVASVATALDITPGYASAVLGGRVQMARPERWAQVLQVSDAELGQAVRVVPRRPNAVGRVSGAVSGQPDTWGTAVRIASRQLARPLTRRQVEVLQLLCSDVSTVKMAAELGVTRATLRTHIRNVYARMGSEVVSRRTARRFILRSL